MILALSQAWHYARAAPMRTGLSVLGIVLGAAALVAMLNISKAAHDQATQNVLKLNPNLWSVMPAGRVSEFRSNDVTAMPGIMPGIISAVPFYFRFETSMVTNDAAPVTSAGFPPGDDTMLHLEIGQGRLLTPFDDMEQHVVLGADVADMLQGQSRGGALGDVVFVAGVGYKIVGILAKKIFPPTIPVDLNAAIIMPVRRLAFGHSQSALMLQVSPNMATDDLQSSIEAYWTPKLGNTAPIITTPADLLQTMQDQNLLFASLLAVTAGISLVIGGAGVTNVMLMAAMQRRQEIGVRLAIGASPADIKWLFFCEAAILSAAGGLLGALGGTALSVLFEALSGMPLMTDMIAVPAGIAAAMTAGLLATIYPAMKTARLDPADAIRSA